MIHLVNDEKKDMELTTNECGRYHFLDKLFYEFEKIGMHEHLDKKRHKNNDHENPRLHGWLQQNLLNVNIVIDL